MSESGVEFGSRERVAQTSPLCPESLQRELGVADAGAPGPLVLITAGLHGNEPAGVHAARRVMAALEGETVSGRIVALAGNLRSLREGRRHGGRDLNRLWRSPDLEQVLAQDPSLDGPDEAELRELHGILERERADARARGRQVVLLDLHSTSAGGGPFVVVPDVIPSRRLARAVGLPVVLGLEQRIEGPLLTWLVARGDTGVVIEGGQHDDPGTVEVLADALRVALGFLRVLPAGAAEARAAGARLDTIRGEAPRVLDMVHAHPVEPGDGFVMEPGWSNFRVVRAGQTLALQGGEVVQAPIDGHMLMPLYQGLGTEGFFLCRPVGPAWLLVSRVARALGLERALVLLPGVRGVSPRRGEVLQRADAPGWTRAWLTLFGYRSAAPAGADLRWTRRPPR